MYINSVCVYNIYVKLEKVLGI